MLKKIKFTINGILKDLEINSGETLLEVIRNRLQLTGTKEGCSVGECGTCTVLVDGKPVNSCLYLAVRANGKEVTTVEGLAVDGKLSKMQQAFIDEGAVQCGFCTPGFLITATAMAAGRKKYTVEEIKEGLTGNFCRCTGYQHIVKAVCKGLGEIE
jgi:carbon-monoxide dehydrogenase small subunit